MIKALPTLKNMVLVQNDARSQKFHGISWFGDARDPYYTLVKGNPADKPITVNGYDLLGSGVFQDELYVAYGDKRRFRHSLDTPDANNQLLFVGLFPLAAESALARWVVRKGGDMVNNGGIVKVAQFLQANPKVLEGWCNVEQDLFLPKNVGYQVFGEPPASAVKSLLKAATKGK